MPLVKIIIALAMVQSSDSQFLRVRLGHVKNVNVTDDGESLSIADAVDEDISKTNVSQVLERTAGNLKIMNVSDNDGVVIVTGSLDEAALKTNASHDFKLSPGPATAEMAETTNLTTNRRECAEGDHSEVTTLGLILAVASAFFNGTFSMFGKFCKQAPDPIIFNSMLCVGVLLSSILVIPFLALLPEGFVLGWTWMGALAGVLLVFATLFSFIAIPLAGLATAAATWSCTAIVVAFLWGAVGPEGVGKSMASPPLCIVAVVILVTGALVLNLCQQIARTCARKDNIQQDKVQGSSMSEVGNTGSIQGASFSSRSQPYCAGSFEVSSKDELADPSPSPSTNVIVGLGCSLLVGIFGGSILVPSSYAEKRLEGLPLIPSFGVGAMVGGTLVGLAYWVAVRRERLSLQDGSPLVYELRGEVVGYGILSGVLWNISNIAQVIAMVYLHMPYGISYPILQCGLLVAGLWGIYFFKEVQDSKAILVFWVGALILMIGVGVLGVYGPGTGPAPPCTMS